MPTIAMAILPAVLKAVIERATDRSTARKIEEAIAVDAAAVNELSVEKPYQSRVAVGSVVASLGVVAPGILNMFGVDVSQSDVAEYLTAIVTLWGAGYALYGRFRSGLKPLFYKEIDQ